MKMNLNQILQQFESAAAGTKAKSSATGKAASEETLWKSFLEQFPGLGTSSPGEWESRVANAQNQIAETECRQNAILVNSY